MKWFVIALLSLTPIAAHANDASLDWSGSPRLMEAHPSVEMRSEIVHLSVGKDTVITDCRFVFVNHGAPCMVRVGFPDDSAERAAGGFGGEIPPSGFTSFKSWIDGKPVQTRIIRGPKAGGEGTIWRVKTVKFAARGRKGSILNLRELYTTPIGGETTFLSRMAGYTLHTGSSWKGPIGRSEIIVTFERAPGQIYNAKPLSVLQTNPKIKLYDDPKAITRFAELMKRWGNVVYIGPGRAVVKGKTLSWVRTKWRPTAKDDITLWFKMP